MSRENAREYSKHEPTDTGSTIYIIRNKKISTSSHIAMKLQKHKGKDAILKVDNKKNNFTGDSCLLFSKKEDRRPWSHVFKVPEADDCQPKTVWPAKLSEGQGGNRGFFPHINQSCKSLPPNTPRGNFKSCPSGIRKITLEVRSETQEVMNHVGKLFRVNMISRK